MSEDVLPGMSLRASRAVPALRLAWAATASGVVLEKRGGISVACA